MYTRDYYLEKFKALQHETAARIEVLKARAGKTRSEAEQDLRDDLARLEQIKRDAETRVEELGAASQAAWEDVSRGFARAYDEITAALAKASRHFD